MNAREFILISNSTDKKSLLRPLLSAEVIQGSITYLGAMKSHSLFSCLPGPHSCLNLSNSGDKSQCLAAQHQQPHKQKRKQEDGGEDEEEGHNSFPPAMEVFPSDVSDLFIHASYHNKPSPFLLSFKLDVCICFSGCLSMARIMM